MTLISSKPSSAPAGTSEDTVITSENIEAVFRRINIRLGPILRGRELAQQRFDGITTDSLVSHTRNLMTINKLLQKYGLL